MTLMIPGWMVLTAVAIGAGVGSAIVVFLFLRNAYIDTDTARHRYMAHQLQGVRQRHDDWEKVPPDYPSDIPTAPLERTITWFLDFVYRRGRK